MTKYNVILCLTAHTYQFRTSNDGSYAGHALYLDNHVLHFRVRACRDASIRLVTTDFSDFGRNTYTVVLGGFENARSTIKRDGFTSALVDVETPNILDCAAFRSFWISWINGLLEVGAGPQYSEYNFMAWQMSSTADIHVVSMATQGQHGEWEVEQNRRESRNYYYLFKMLSY